MEKKITKKNTDSLKKTTVYDTDFSISKKTKHQKKTAFWKNL
jgi:hypothetical protein